MMRENVLVLLLVISLCGNVILVFFNPLLTGSVPGLNSSPDFPGIDLSKISGHNEFIVDEYGNLIAVPPTSETEGAPDLTDPYTESALSPDSEAEDLNQSAVLIRAEPTLTLTPTPTPEVTEEVPLDPWVTYASTKYGFSLRYPRNWSINEAVAGRTVLTLTAPIETGCDADNSQCYNYIANFTVEIDQKPQTVILEDYFNKAVSNLQLNFHITTTSKSAPALISDVRAYQIEYYTHA
ncbi:MAG: hypothetical protein LUQ37_03155, partial [Methanoregulaceae archaeon]|nr:hypothetical protein [Methanoregulaceae archaeon]